ncbi:acyl-CoA dehydrogenase family protein [Pseudonocardia sp. D17]|uniref:acyl-CoA dehydrogenase family protein n=1 Tax=Pseudonocardia sp. D17 TaxID=882661 RepID=UPI002B3FB372|nr:acyl-CoA dehydrogenase [Pseudonocardia sp. D17]
MPIDFTPSDEQRAVRARAREFARDVLSRVAKETHGLPTARERYVATRPFYEEMVRAGFLRLLVPQALGGDGTGAVTVAILAEELIGGDPSVALSLFSTSLGLAPLLRGGSPEQHERFLGPFLRTEGAPVASLAFSEPGGSANYLSTAPGTGLRTTARARGGSLVIDGTKQWVSGATGWDGTGPDLMSVACRLTARRAADRGVAVVAVPGPVEGLRVTGELDPLGHRAHLLPRFDLVGVTVPRENVLGGPGEGPALLASAFGGAAVGACAVGVMRAAFAHALDFARSDRRGGPVPVIDHQGVAFVLADVKTRIEATRALTWRACHAADRREPYAEELGIHAKVFGSEAAVQSLTELMRVVGVQSYSHESPLAGLMADALAYPLFSGGNIGFRRRRLQEIFSDPGYDAVATADA